MLVNEARLVRASVFLWIGLLCLFGWASVPGLFKTQHVALLLALLGLHVALHWWMLYRSVPARWLLAYFAVQSALVFSMGWFTPYVTLPLGLFAILAGQATGYLLRLWQRGALIGLYVVLMAVLISAVEGLDRSLIPPMLAGVSAFLLMVVVVVTLYQRQVQARGQAEAAVAELKRAHEQLRAYAERVEDLTLMSERQRMARELHDTLAQGLAGLILQLEAVEAHLAQGRAARAQEIVRQAMARARTALADSRRTIDQLRNDGLPADDFGAALRAEVAGFCAIAALDCHLDLGELPPLPEEVQDHALRAVAESLTNVARHARASQAWVRVARDGDALALEIRDDGVGFDPHALRPQQGHYGLLGLRERAELTGGTLDILSAPGAGTRVRLRLPLRKRRYE
ncbi:MAG TPA: sensor histidine kinase [Roseiflexaceae bacterium]|nr:sensor histidine kinase [Roseiflexaceae bacterium]